MIIRSQDKKRIANISTCNLIAILGTQGKSKNITVDGMVIGTYSTEKNAIKVLDMIAQQYASYSCRYGSDCSHYAVFQMPSDEEVEV